MHTHGADTEKSSDALVAYMKFQEPLKAMIDGTLDRVRYLLPPNDATGDELVNQVREAGRLIASGVDAAVESWRVEKEPHTLRLESSVE